MRVVCVRPRPKVTITPPNRTPDGPLSPQRAAAAAQARPVPGPWPSATTGRALKEYRYFGKKCQK
eukprot:969588-Prymnesium_polylepis.2